MPSGSRVAAVGLQLRIVPSTPPGRGPTRHEPGRAHACCHQLMLNPQPATRKFATREKERERKSQRVFFCGCGELYVDKVEAAVRERVTTTVSVCTEYTVWSTLSLCVVEVAWLHTHHTGYTLGHSRLVDSMFSGFQL
jgi:hypothetical protein